jgi:dihydrofolate reductase
MRKIILYLASSIDGFIAKCDGSVDWIDNNVDLEEFSFNGFLQEIDTIFMGRKSYEQVLSFGSWPYLNQQTYVFSKTISKTNSINTEIESNLTVDFVNQVKNQTGKNIWLFGGGKLNQFFLVNDLIDEIMLFIQPIIIGNGVGIFANQEIMPKKFKLKKAQSLNKGFSLLWYQKH